MRVSTVLVLVCCMACGAPAPTGVNACTYESDALLLSVADNTTGGPPSAASIVYASEGAWADTLSGYDPFNSTTTYAFPVVGPPATYAVHIVTPGYADWSLSGVTVASDDCGQPRTVELTARLTKSGS